MRVTIFPGEPDSKPWSKNGRSGTIVSQQCEYETSRLRGRGRWMCGDNPLKPGIYEVNLEEQVVLNQFGELKLVNKMTTTLVELHQPEPAHAEF